MPDSIDTPMSAHTFNTDFWKFWTGETISNLGSSFTNFALPLLIYQQTSSAINLALSTAFSLLPYLLFGLFIGAWADRVNRKQMMILADIGSAAIIGSIPLLAALGGLSQRGFFIIWVYVVIFVSQTLAAFFNAGQFAAIPGLVSKESLVTANGRIQASFAAAGIVGPLLGSVLLLVAPLPALLIIDAASFLVSAGTLSLIRISFNQTHQLVKASVREDVSEGLRYVLRHPVLRNISLMMALINFINPTTQSQLALFAKQRLGATDSQVVLLYSAASIGIITLSLLAGPLRRRWPFSRIVLGAMMLSGLLTLALALTRWYWLGLLLWALIMGVNMLFIINTGSLRQTIVPNQLLGRVQMIAQVVAWSPIPFGVVLGGLAIEWTGSVALVYGAIGVLKFCIPLGFALTALGVAERYLPKAESKAGAPAPADAEALP